MSNPSTLARLIISKMNDAIGGEGDKYSDSTPALAQQAIADAITEFVTTYVMSKSSYTGQMIAYPNPADPVVVDDHQITGTCAPTGIHDNLASWLDELSGNIRDGFEVLPGLLMVTFDAPYKPFGGSIKVTTKQLKPIHEGNDDSPQFPVWEAIADGVINMIIGNVSGNTGTAQRPGQSTGTAPATVTLNYLLGSGAPSAPRRASSVTYIADDYLDWDIDTWDDFLWY